MKRTLTVALAASLIGAAFAAPVSMQYNASANILDGNTYTLPNGNGGAGLLGFKYDPAGGTNYTVSKVGYCLTPTQYINSPWMADILTSGMEADLPISAAQAGQIGYLAGLLGGGGTGSQHAEVQIAIWTVLGATISGGNATTLANGQALAVSTVGQSAGYTWYKSVRASDGSFKSQDMVEAVPEPFTLALGASALGLAIARRRRAR